MRAGQHQPYPVSFVRQAFEAYQCHKPFHHTRTAKARNVGSVDLTRFAILVKGRCILATSRHETTPPRWIYSIIQIVLYTVYNE